MANQVYTRPQSAHSIAIGFIAIAKAVGVQNVHIVVASSIQAIVIQANTQVANLDKDPNLQTFIKDTKARPDLPCENASLKSTGQQPMFSLIYGVDGNTSYFKIEQGDRDTAIKVYDAVKDNFAIALTPAILGGALPGEAQAAIQYRELAVLDLKAAVERLGNYLAQMAEKNSDQVRAITTELESLYQQKNAGLEKQNADRQHKFEAAESDLEKQKKEFDDRQSKHVRRALLEKIQKNITERKSAAAVTPGAQRSRTYIHIVAAAVILASLAGILVSGAHLYESSGKPPFDWRVVPPFSLASLVFAATLIFYFRWTSRWADRLAHNDLAVDQYASDIMRASWIAELLFEYKDDKGGEIPADVLHSLTEGLFKREEFAAAAYHPTDDVASLIKRVKSFKLGPGNIEITAGKG